MKAIYQGKVWIVYPNDTMAVIWVKGFPAHPHEKIKVPYGSEDLIIDPTDTQLEEVGYLGDACSAKKNNKPFWVILTGTGRCYGPYTKTQASTHAEQAKGAIIVKEL